MRGWKDAANEDFLERREVLARSGNTFQSPALFQRVSSNYESKPITTRQKKGSRSK